MFFAAGGRKTLDSTKEFSGNSVYVASRGVGRTESIHPLPNDSSWSSVVHIVRVSLCVNTTYDKTNTK